MQHLAAKKVHKKSHHKKDYQDRHLPKQREPAHFSSALPENHNDGLYKFKDIKDLFYDK